MAQGLLQGIMPPRPLFLPIVFSSGARVESQPLPAFLTNPTKICSSQRQLRGHLSTDGFSCYFDPFLEVEALGATLQWGAADRPPVVRWPRSAEPGELPDDLCTPDEMVKAGRVPIALDVLRRMKAMLRDDSILMAGVSGPFTLAARLVQMDAGSAWRSRKPPESAWDVALAMVTRISSALVEAGASMIMIEEGVLPDLSQERCAAWASGLEPAFNVIRFYGAVPVLSLTDGASFTANSEAILHQHWDCVLCPSLDGFFPNLVGGGFERGSTILGFALPLETFQLADSALHAFRESLRQMLAAWHPAILTTAGDVPAMTDIKRLTKVLEIVPRLYR
jgi:Uroporphyrinogen decarboxylase (URO-D)